MDDGARTDDNIMANAVILLGALIVLATILLLQFRWHWYALQYVYFLRVPIVSAIALVLSFTLAFDITIGGGRLATVGPGPFHNLFVLALLPLGLITFVAIVAAWTIAHAFRWVYVNTPLRLGLSLRGYQDEVRDGRTVRVPTRLNTISEDKGIRKHAAYALLAVPLVASAAIASPNGWPLKLLWMVIGAGLAFLVLYLTRRFGGTTTAPAGAPARPPDPQELRGPRTFVQRLAGSAAKTIDERFTRWFGPKATSGASRGDESDPASVQLASGNLQLAIVVSACTYVVIAVTLWPGFQAPLLMTLQGSIPALVYLLLLLVLVTLVLSWLSLRLDKYRVPAELAIVIAIALLYRLPFTDTDHYYNVERDTTSESGSVGALEPVEYLQAWRQRRPESDLIVVAASGGGVSAAAWTAAVLGGLQTGFPDRFAPSIALISTTSGGGVGAMYYVGAFRPPAVDGPPDVPYISSNVVWLSAGRSSLGAVAWGIAYPEMARLVFPPLSFGWDRGWALERRWAQPLTAQQPAFEHTIRQWARDASAGWRPAQVFNATHVETGRRFLISPLALHGVAHDASWRRDPDESWRALNFTELYPGWDVDVTTAARLSATFPYASPVASPLAREGAIDPKTAYHVADGGYFDNFGVMTAIDFVREILPALRKEVRRPRVLFVEIRASSSIATAAPRAGAGFRMETLGPAETIMTVRATSQLERNNLELQLLRDAAGDIVGPSAVFELRATAPLSWHLSYEEAELIRAYWDAQCPSNRAALERVAEFLGRPVPPRQRTMEDFCADAPPAPAGRSH